MHRRLQQAETERNLWPYPALRHSPRGLEANGRLIRSDVETGAGARDLPIEGVDVLGLQMGIQGPDVFSGSR